MKYGKRSKEEEQVEQLLQATQDELMLNLTIDSHISRSSPHSSLQSDLDHRFQALKSRPSTSSSDQSRSLAHPSSLSSSTSSSSIPNVSVDEELKSVLGDDLSVRFAALKASLTSSSSSGAANLHVGPPVSNGVDDEDEDDEVEKLIQWAKDAARLDPSPPSDDDEDDKDCITDDDLDRR